MDPPYEPHTHKGALPETQVENGKLHTGSCHCGKLTVAINVPAVDSTYPDKMLECNCSICERVRCLDARIFLILQLTNR